MNNSSSNNLLNSNNVYSGTPPLTAESSGTDSAPARDVIAINIDSDSQPNTGTSTQHRENITRINMETSHSGVTSNSPRLSNGRNLLLLFNEARSQLGRQTSHPETSIQQQQRAAESRRLSNPAIANAPQTSYDNETSPRSPSSHARYVRSWRMNLNLNDVLSLSSTPTTQALRSFISHSSGFRYTPLNTNENSSNSGDNIHLLMNQGTRMSPTSEGNDFRMPSRSGNDIQQQQHLDSGTSIIGSPPESSIDSTNSTSSNRQINVSMRNPIINRSNSASQGNTGGGADMDEDNSVISDLFVKVLSHFVRYLPFICILFIKFIHDHLLGILDLLLLHGVMYQVNKSLRDQIAKFSQKSYGILLRDFGMVAFFVTYRILLASSAPDPFGLLIGPSTESLTMEVSSISNGNSDPSVASNEDRIQPVVTVEMLDNYLNQLIAKPKTVSGIKTITLGLLLYYVAVNDLVLKLLTILVKISITMMPTKVIRHKPRARMFVLVEYLSQFYRALAPVHQWLLFLFESYSGLEVISGVLFASFYMGAKGFEFVERGKSLRKAFINFYRNMDYERKPTKDELDAADSLCPICHDAYSTPVVLECGHIFCDDCVSTWFKREQTCPMCRAKVCEDPTWQDGSTTFFYQLC